MIPPPLGAGLLVAGAAMLAYGWKGALRYRRVAAARRCRVASALGRGTVRLEGKVLPSEQGLLTAPLSGQPAVYVRTRVLEHRRRTFFRRARWVTLIDDTDSRVFLLDDRSGPPARVEPGGAVMVLAHHQRRSTGGLRRLSPQDQAFAMKRGIDTTTTFGFAKLMIFEEELLAPGARVTAVGEASAAPDSPEADDYRGSPQARIGLASSIDGERELVVSDCSDRQLTWRLLGWAVAGLLSLFAGLASAALGLWSLR